MADTDKVNGPDLTQGVPLSKLEEGTPFLGRVNDDAVVVVKQRDQLFAIGARCTHYGGPLEKGLVVDGTIRCPWHHAQFDLKTGQARGAPAFEATGCYPVEIDGFHFRVLPKDSSSVPSDESTPSDVSPPFESIVIVGAGAAGAAAAETLRKEGFSGSITMIGQEASGPVDRPNLSKDYLAGDAPEEWVFLGGDEHWDELEVDLIVGDSVVAIDRKVRSVQTEKGRSIDYDRLLIATGAEPIVPPIGGLESTRYFTLRSLADTRAIVAAVDGAERVLVLGASFIGLEVAASLRKRGLQVTVVAPESLPLANVFGDEVGQLVRSVHEQNGVEFHLGAKIEELDGGTARLSNNAEVSFDFVVLGVGVMPRTELAAAAGLEVDRGIVVDAHFRTNDEAIYAVGDVACYPDPTTASLTRIEHWVLAQRQAQKAVRTMLDEGTGPFRDIPFFWSRHFGLTVHYIGHAPDFDEVAVAGHIADRDATIGYLRDGRIQAVATIGRALDGLRAEWALAEDDQERLRDLVGR